MILGDWQGQFLLWRRARKGMLPGLPGTLGGLSFSEVSKSAPAAAGRGLTRLLTLQTRYSFFDSLADRLAGSGSCDWLSA